MKSRKNSIYTLPGEVIDSNSDRTESTFPPGFRQKWHPLFLTSDPGESGYR